MTLNTNLLSTLVTWAAADHLRHTDTDRAVQLGVAKEDDPRLGRWQQDSWGVAERNGYCSTAFCMAGGAVHLEEDLLPVMSTVGGGQWGAEFVIPVGQVPEHLEENIKWDILWLDADEAYNLACNGELTRIHGAAEELLGLSVEESSWLFDGGNTIEKVVSYAIAIADHRDEDLDIPEWVPAIYADEDLITMFNEHIYHLVA